MECVQAGLGVGAALVDGALDPLGGVRADQLDLGAALLAEQIEEAAKGLGVPSGAAQIRWPVSWSTIASR